jgi:hypothetical protein
MLFKVFGVIVTFILGAILGLNLSKNIQNEILYTLFWILYIITYLTFANIIAVALFYSVLNTKTGPPGSRGPQGVPGDVGDEGICQSGCQSMQCTKEIQEAFIQKINELAGNPIPPVKLNNLFIKNQLKGICQSEQFQKTAEIKGAESIMGYIKDIVKDWAKVIYDASQTKFVESVGGEDNFDWIGNNPFKEIEKYDIYYWKTNKLFKPIGVDICDNPKINKLMPQKEKPRLFITKTNVYDRVWDSNKRSRQALSVFKPKNMYNEDIKLHMYPMGDVAVAGKRHEIGGPKNVGGISAPMGDGPKKESHVVSGDVKPPERFEKKARGNFWTPVGPEGYTCLGDVASTDGRPPSKYKYRCVPTECVERVSDETYNGAYIWQDKGSIWGPVGSQTDGIGNEIGYENYNLFRAVEGDNGHHKPFYKIRQVCLDSSLPPKKSHEPGDWVSNKWHGYPERNPKYSIFNFLEIVPEGIIQNYETQGKYYFVTTSNHPNSYFIKFFSVTRFMRGNLEVMGRNDVKVNLTTNRDKIEQKWYFEYTDPLNVYIRSKKTHRYLGMHYYQGHLLIVKQYDKPEGKRTLWRIRTTTTGEKYIKQIPQLNNTNNADTKLNNKQNNGNNSLNNNSLNNNSLNNL